MPQKYSQKVVNTFVKGLVTEASEMTFPENASSDELNCDLLKNGARRRRKGIEYEDNYQESTFTVEEGDFVHSFTWSNVSGLSGTEFLVVQVNNTVYFYDKSYATLSAGQKSFSISLTTYSAANSFNPAEEPIQGASVNGQLIITSAAINPIRVKYTSSTNSIEVNAITVNIRDFDQQYTDITNSGVNKNNYDLEPAIGDLGNSTTSADFIQYQYDLYNMGWYSTNTGRLVNGVKQSAWEYWDSQETTYPPRNKPWWLAKNASMNMDTDGLQKVYAGNTLAPVGHYILNFFSKDRQDVSNITSAYLPTEIETARFRTTAAYAGRVWFAGLDSSKNGGKVFFSRVIQSDADYDRYHQMSDPTEEDSAGVVDSDGGYLLIPDASNIRKLFTMGSALLVFAQNGIWIIGGVDQIFKASEFYIRKLSPFGISTARSLVDAMGTPIFWDVSGIYAVTTDGNVAGAQEAVKQISQPIKSFFEGISNDKKEQVVSIFDRLNKRVYWMYPDNDETVAHKFNKILVLDLELEAFFPWTISDKASAGVNTPYIMGGVFLSGFGSADTPFNTLSGSDTVILSSKTITNKARTSNVATITTSTAHGLEAGDYVTVASSDSTFNGTFTVASTPTTTTFTYANTGNNVTSTSATGTAGLQLITTVESSGIVDTDVKFLVKTATDKLTFGTFTQSGFLDWDSDDFDSYAETGYDFMGDATLKKNNPYITSYIRRTEENFVSDGAGGYEADFPSSCMLVVKWDFGRDSSRWSSPSQIYRLANYPIANPEDLTFNYPYDTIVSRTKIRGKGRVLRLKFYSETGKDFYLIGWEHVFAANPRF